jgi:hypothetical protein
MSGDTAHQEKHFETYIVSRLQKQGWLGVCPGNGL